MIQKKSPGGILLCYSGASSVAEKDREHTKQREKQKYNKDNETIARDSFFVAKRSQSLDSARGKITHQLGIRGGWSPKMVLNSAKQRRQVIFPASKVVVMLRAVGLLGSCRKPIGRHLLKNRLFGAARR